MTLLNRFRALAAFLIATFSCLSAQAGLGDNYRLFVNHNQEPVAEYKSFEEFKAEMASEAVGYCSGGLGWGNCVHTQDKYGVPYSTTRQTFYAGWAGVYGQYNGAGYATEDYWTAFCPAGQVWWMVNGNEVCVPSKDVYADGRCTPSHGRAIFPMTGAQKEPVDLGFSLDGKALTVTYDTTSKIPETNGGSGWAYAPPPSFGELWQSSFHKRFDLQSPSGSAATAYSGIALQSGNARETLSASGVAGCGGGTGMGNVTVGAGSNYVSDMQASHQFNVSSSAALFVNKADLFEEAFDNVGVAKTSFADGRFISYFYSTSDTLSATAPAAGLLIKATDQFGHSISFAYEQPSGQLSLAPPRVISVTGPDGATATFSYDPDWGNLSTISWPDQSSQSFKYTNSAYPWQLTQILDENGALNATLGYIGPLASSTEEGSGVNRYQTNYSADTSQQPHWQVDKVLVPEVPVICRVHHWVTPDSLDVFTPRGDIDTVTTSVVANFPQLTAQTQPAGSGCAAGSSSQNYDAAGNLVRYVDFNGSMSCYAYDLTRNLRTVSVQGLSSVGTCPSSLTSYAPSTANAAYPERKTTTVWHPDWVLKAREAEPKKITTWVYNGQSDPIAGGNVSCAPTSATLPDGKPIAVLCARYEQATTDTTGALGVSATATGATRKWSYTYNRYGQVLTETTPMLSSTDTLSHTTTYSYYSDTSLSNGVGHTLGDLYTVSNPLGQVTTYTSYDAAGRLLSSTDANGTVTTQTYWPRGWLKSQTVTPTSGAAQTTSYAYWPTGLLKTVTLADGTMLNYSYDDAHRLTDITDAAGNKLHYVLDNSGNRTSEQVSDASGNLASTVTRVFDALNRVQSQTGAVH